ncbi:hypothetical protein Tco_0825243 [Tanacetum coccineum]
MEFMEKRRKHFAALRAQEKRKRPPTKTQKRNQMSIYLKHMGGYKHNQLKGRSYDEIQKLFDKEMKRVNSFVAMNSEAQEISGKKDESSSKKAKIAQDSSAKRAGDKLESDKSKKQKTDENEEVEVDNEAELKKHMFRMMYLGFLMDDYINTLIESWENTQAMMEADRLLAERLQTREQEELTNEEKAKLFMEFMEKRRKYFAALRAQEKRN